MTAFGIIQRLVGWHGKVPVVVVGRDGSAVPKNCLHRGHMEQDKSYQKVVRFREYYPDKWQYPPARLHMEPRSEWIRYVRQHAPHAAIVSMPPYAYHNPQDEPNNMIILKDLLQSVPRLFDAVPGLREEAENIILLEELS